MLSLICNLKQVICDDISLAMKLWEQIDSFQCLELNGEKDWLTDTSIPLLLNMLELLALKVRITFLLFISNVWHAIYIHRCNSMIAF
jgi:hypothetical protein